MTHHGLRGPLESGFLIVSHQQTIRQYQQHLLSIHLRDLIRTQSEVAGPTAITMGTAAIAMLKKDHSNVASCGSVWKFGQARNVSTAYAATIQISACVRHKPTICSFFAYCTCLYVGQGSLRRQVKIGSQ